MKLKRKLRKTKRLYDDLKGMMFLTLQACLFLPGYYFAFCAEPVPSELGNIIVHGAFGVMIAVYVITFISMCKMHKQLLTIRKYRRELQMELGLVVKFE